MKDDPSNLSMMELFRVEAENQTALLTTGLLELEKAASGDVNSEVASGTPAPCSSALATLLESLMRAAHSLKGAARIVNIASAVRVAHAMEDCFVAAQAGQLQLRQPHIDLLLRGVDLLTNVSKQAAEVDSGRVDSSELSVDRGKPSTINDQLSADVGVEDFVSAITRLRRGLGESRAEAVSEGGKSISAFQSFSVLAPAKPPAQPESTFQEHRPSHPSKPPPSPSELAERGVEGREGHKANLPERVLRLTAENLNRLLGLAGESLVESRWLRPFSESMQRLKRMQSDLERSLEGIKQLAVSGNRAILDTGYSILDQHHPASSIQHPASSIQQQLSEFQSLLREASLYLGERLQELDLFDRRSAHLSNRLYLEVLRTRMRPFGDGTRRFPRMVRDLARSLGKQARLEVRGENTQVDRDILDRLETPLAHLLRNALDHGCEPPAERVRAGKPPEATIRVEARHSAGMLLVTVSDDGAGLDWEALRKKVDSFLEARSEKLETRILTPSSSLLSPNLSENDLLQFLFLPGFSLRETVTELSGRGVGLDVVQNMVRSVRGSMRVTANKARLDARYSILDKGHPASSIQQPLSAFSSGLTFTLQLPLTMSVLRTLLVEVGGEPYAFPLAQIAQTCQLPLAQIESLEGRPHFKLGMGNAERGKLSSELRVPSSEFIGLVAGRQLFGENAEKLKTEKLKSISEFQSFSVSAFPSELPIVVLGEASRVTGRYGLVVDRFLGERELVVQPLDRRLGKVRDISAAALMEDGAPVLIVDVDDLLRSIETLVREGTVANVVDGPGLMVDGGKPSTINYQPSTIDHQPRRKRILAVDDSLTVRELERKLLTGRGYVAEVAHDGLEAWEMLMQTKAESRKQKAETGDPFQLSAFPISAFPPYDLVITDVDMPRLDGIELVKRIKGDAQLKSLPVMIVSFKDREEDRLRGLAAGADYYLTKGSFADDTLLQAVLDLIGEPVA